MSHELRALSALIDEERNLAAAYQAASISFNFDEMRQILPPWMATLESIKSRSAKLLHSE